MKLRPHVLVALSLTVFACKGPNPAHCVNTPCKAGFTCDRQSGRCIENASDGGSVAVDGAAPTGKDGSVTLAPDGGMTMGARPDPGYRALVSSGSRSSSRSYYVIKSTNATPGQSNVNASTSYRNVGNPAGAKK
jgi:hypothetical protein